MAGDVILPSLRQPLPKIAMVLDTSGSMDDHLLAQSLAEVQGVLLSLGVGRRHLKIVCCDAKAFEAQKVMRARDVELLGGGGADMGAGLAKAAELRPRPDLIVVLTDGHTPWPTEPPRGIRVIVGLMDSSGRVPEWARTVSINLPGAAEAHAVGCVMQTRIDAGEPEDREPEELAEWLAAGFNAEIADVWRQWRFSISRARAWVAAGIDDGLRAAQWSTGGVAPDTVQEWRAVGIEANEAVRWHEFGYGFEAARTEKAKGHSPDEAYAEAQAQPAAGATQRLLRAGSAGAGFVWFHAWTPRSRS